jgi:hypothetical protein
VASPYGLSFDRHGNRQTVRPHASFVQRATDEKAAPRDKLMLGPCAGYFRPEALVTPAPRLGLPLDQECLQACAPTRSTCRNCDRSACLQHDSTSRFLDVVQQQLLEILNIRRRRRH